jgi:hypothetical protein
VLEVPGHALKEVGHCAANPPPTTPVADPRRASQQAAIAAGIAAGGQQEHGTAPRRRDNGHDPAGLKKRNTQPRAVRQKVEPGGGPGS